ncbi:MAG: DUF1330 domain-containing protein [SAR324 cluster bacterium]|nr:DUF1330 domain-containing protein [SAR324 cluster bacterium]
MAGTVVVRVDVTVSGKLKDYRALAVPSVENYGGRILLRGVAGETLEESWDFTRVVELEFESLQRTKEWYNSPEYREAVAAREGAATFHMLAVAGV